MKDRSTRRGFTQDIVNKNSHSRVSSSGICCDEKRDPRLRTSGMTGRSAFTLIELLVVVIIIAILAAIALPQYNKAVMKSRFASLKPIAKSVKDAQEIYFNREGQYAGESELGDLDIAIPEEAQIEVSAEGDHLYVRANHTGLPHNSYTMYFNQSGNYAGNIYCEAYTGDTVAENLCIAEGGQTGGPQNGDYTLYLLSGNSTGEFASTNVFAHPQTAFKALVEAYANTPSVPAAFTALGLDCDYNQQCTVGDWTYSGQDGSSGNFYATNTENGYNTHLSITVRGGNTLVTNPGVSCSGFKCPDICGSTNCSIALNDW